MVRVKEKAILIFYFRERVSSGWSSAHFENIMIIIIGSCTSLWNYIEFILNLVFLLKSCVWRLFTSTTTQAMTSFHWSWLQTETSFTIDRPHLRTSGRPIRASSVVRKMTKLHKHMKQLLVSQGSTCVRALHQEEPGLEFPLISAKLLRFCGLTTLWKPIEARKGEVWKMTIN